MTHSPARPTPVSDLPALFDLSTPAGQASFAGRLERLKATVRLDGPQAAAVAEMLAAVRREGDAAVVRLMRQFTDPDFSAERLVVTEAELDAALAGLAPDLRGALERAIAQVREYQTHILPPAHDPIRIGGAELGLRFSPVDSAGLYVPGGSAVLFSTVIMTAVPALVAGVPAEKLAVCCPPPTRGAGAAHADVAPVVLATCRLLGLSRVYRMGGAQAVAALAYGTERVKPVDFIAGPGNVFVQLAKAQVAGIVGTEGGFYGPSEIVTVADASARPDWIASDLLAQAEHNPGKCFLVAWERGVIERVAAEVERQLAQRGRASFIEKALREDSCALLCRDAQQAAQVANELAGEHVNLAVADPQAWLPKIRHAGEVFLGAGAPVAAGDYYAGPSHCLPTGTTARFGSGLSVYTFLKRTGTVAYPQGMPAQAVRDIALLARAEGLDAHAISAELRAELRAQPPAGGRP